MNAASQVPPDDDGLPIVAGDPRPDRAPWIFGGAIALAALLLFTTLNARREAIVAPSTTAAQFEPGSRIAPAPPLALPASYANTLPPRPVLLRQLPRAARPVDTPVVRQIPAPAPSSYRSTSSDAPSLEPRDPIPRQPDSSGVVFEAPRQIPALPAAAAAATQSGERVYAQRFDNPGYTVPRGTVIPAVLETALDSTRPGTARALVQRDVYSFDGSRVLVPRGSRLVGAYASDLAQGQNRALVTWERLIRPDGATIALASPASDPLGRAGIRGKVDSKFFQRFGGAILQSILDVGVNVAAREAGGDTVVVALPGSTPQVSGQSLQSGQAAPTLKVRHGTSVSVFVARDLDFSTVEL